MVYLPKVVYHWEVCPTWRWLYPQKYAILKNPLIFRESLPYFGKNRVIPLLWGPWNTPPSQTAWRCPCAGFLAAPPHCRRRHKKPYPRLPAGGFSFDFPAPKIHIGQGCHGLLRSTQSPWGRDKSPWTLPGSLFSYSKAMYHAHGFLITEKRGAPAIYKHTRYLYHGTHPCFPISPAAGAV